MDFYSVKNRPPREQLQLDYETSLIEVTKEISVQTQIERLLAAGERLQDYMKGDEYDYDGDIPEDDDLEPWLNLDTPTDIQNEIEYQESLAYAKAQRRAAKAARPKQSEQKDEQTEKVEAPEKTPQGEL